MCKKSKTHIYYHFFLMFHHVTNNLHEYKWGWEFGEVYKFQRSKKQIGESAQAL